MASKVTDPHDLLVHKLSVLLTTEREIERMLPTLANEAHDDELRDGLERHLEETRQHVRNLEQAFEILGAEPQGTSAPAIEGLHAQHESIASSAADDVLPDVLDAVSTGSAAETEHHEIAAYEGVITLAKGLGLLGVAQALHQNLEDEQQMLRDVKRISERLSHKERETIEGRT
jgi:ferritin-like metal-binding protein YciE